MPYHVAFEKEGFITAGEDKKIPINDQGTLDMKLLKTSEGKAGPGAAPGRAGREVGLRSGGRSVQPRRRTR